MMKYKGGKVVISGWAPQRVVAMVTKQASVNLHAVGEFVAKEARQNAPFDTGLLRKNITYRVVRDGKNYVCWVGAKRPAFHAYLVEVGTSGHSMANKKGGTQKPSLTDTIDWFGKPGNVRHPGTRAKPYLRPAVYDNADRIVRIFQRGRP